VEGSHLEIADRPVVSYFPVETHVSHPLTKLDARDLAQLVMIAHQAGLSA
jgi:DNA-binding NarL/FixJ family response regulator